jgi:hypothetical protein
MNEAGKGDKRRPTDESKYQSNYDSIFRKEKKHDDTATTNILGKTGESFHGKGSNEGSSDSQGGDAT